MGYGLWLTIGYGSYVMVFQDYECRDADDMFGLSPLNKFGARGGLGVTRFLLAEITFRMVS
jgi:hypothetical protein